MENYTIELELVNSKTHMYELSDTNIESIYEKISNAPDGWLELTSDGEVHFIKVDKITKVSVLPDSLKEKRIEDNVEMISNIKF